ncbi:MAG: hypothetical protein C0399_04045 [Syntrophus sp. (in: bacteria)]|nr:hypothetical protein [Syntrophus sp. (in: bacteria)]
MRFLDSWKKSPEDKIINLIGIFSKTLEILIDSKKRWISNEMLSVFGKTRDSLRLCLSPNANTESNNHNLVTKNQKCVLFAHFDCPFCNSTSGKRPSDRYFNEWNDADKLQISNLLYEVSLVFNAVLSEKPPWADATFLKSLKECLSASREALESIGLSECSLCGRFVNSIEFDENRNFSICPWCRDDQQLERLPEGMVWGMRAPKMDERPPLIFDLQLPTPPDPHDIDKVLSFVRSLQVDGKKLIYDEFMKCVDGMKRHNFILSFEDRSMKTSYYWDQPYNDDSHWNFNNLYELVPADFIKRGFYGIGFVAFDLHIPNTGEFRAPDGAIPRDRIVRTSKEHVSEFIRLNSPWKVRFRKLEIESRTDYDFFQFNAYVGIKFPILHESALPDKATCKHEFRLLDRVGYEWRLIWECGRCGYICFCNCFKEAIEAKLKYKRIDCLEYDCIDLEYTNISRNKVNIKELPFHDNACELCRGLTSSHDSNTFDDDFGRKYGAYIIKRTIELWLEGAYSKNFKLLEAEAKKQMKKVLAYTFFS